MADTPIKRFSQEEQQKLEEKRMAEAESYRNDVLERRQARFDNPEPPLSDYEVRQARAELMAHLAGDNTEVYTNSLIIADNPIAVRHNSEEPGEIAYGEDPDLVKLRSDTVDYTLQPEEHRVPRERQLNGEPGEGGIVPEEAKVIMEEPPLDPDGKAKGLKTLGDGVTIDSEGDKNTQQPEGHNPEGLKVEKVDDTSPKIDIDVKREEFKRITGKPANSRWSIEHMQTLIDEENAKRKVAGE